jgi:hypothetical protein
MTESIWCEKSRTGQGVKLTMTDLERFKNLLKFIKASEKKMAAMQKDPKIKIDEIIREKIFLEASKQLVDKIKPVISMF